MTTGQYRQRLHPVLTDLLNRLVGAPAGDDLTQRAVTVSTSTLVGEPIDRAVALIPHRWMLDRAVGDGIAFLAAGYPKTRRRTSARRPALLPRIPDQKIIPGSLRDWDRVGRMSEVGC